jgi:hypothetical protein
MTPGFGKCFFTAKKEARLAIRVKELPRSSSLAQMSTLVA